MYTFAVSALGTIIAKKLAVCNIMLTVMSNQGQGVVPGSKFQITDYKALPDLPKLSLPLSPPGLAHVHRCRAVS